jgi:hypothetical protein
VGPKDSWAFRAREGPSFVEDRRRGEVGEVKIGDAIDPGIRAGETVRADEANVEVGVAPKEAPTEGWRR